MIYLPVTPTPQLQSFAVPILNVTDSRVTAPWFGANKWEAIIQPVQGGGIPPQHAELDLVMEFKEGGAFDFATTYTWKTYLHTRRADNTPEFQSLLLARRWMVLHLVPAVLLLRRPRHQAHKHPVRYRAREHNRSILSLRQTHRQDMRRFREVALQTNWRDR